MFASVGWAYLCTKVTIRLVALQIQLHFRFDQVPTKGENWRGAYFHNVTIPVVLKYPYTK